MASYIGQGSFTQILVTLTAPGTNSLTPSMKNES